MIFDIEILFTRCPPGAACYSEIEPVNIKIINNPPIINDPKASEMTIYDNLTNSLTFTQTDPEGSDLKKFRLIGSYPSWVTISDDGILTGAPNI
jgi:hypothetical protein